MFELLKDYPGQLTINNKQYNSVEEAESDFKDYKGGITIVLNGVKSHKDTPKIDCNEKVFQISVRRYMTNYSKDFFLETWNDMGPMPFVTMIGIKLQETEKLVKMKLWADLCDGKITTCMCCGRPLSNPLSQYLGVGPECGASKHLKLLESGVNIQEVRKQFKEKLNEVTWEGWIIKSAITQVKEIEYSRKE